MTTAASSPDPISEPESKRKKPSRVLLFAPFVLLALLAAAVAGFWLVASRQLTSGIDARAEALRQAGYTVDMEGRRVEGFPFRLKLRFDQARIASPSGWSITVPGLAAEAYLHNPGHWVVAAPQGFSFNRPQGGRVDVKGQALRGSIAGTDAAPWRIVLQASKATFTPASGARPFSLASADLLELYIRPAPGAAGEGMTLFRLEGGKGQPGSLLGQIAGTGAITAALEGRLTKTDAFGGPDWGSAVRAWSRAGGVLQKLQGTAVAGAFSAKTTEGTLGVGADGRLTGALPLELKQAGRALTALAESEAVAPEAAGTAAAVAAARARGEAASINLVFQAGVMTLGPVSLGPSPKVG